MRGRRWIRDERGSMLVFMYGVALVMVVLSGICVDGWRAVSAHRALSTNVDAAAAAGANGIDEGAWQQSTQLRLDPRRAEALAADTLGAQSDASALSGVSIIASPDDVTVDAELTVDMTLLRLFGQSSITVHATAVATPRRSP